MGRRSLLTFKRGKELKTTHGKFALNVHLPIEYSFPWRNILSRRGDYIAWYGCKTGLSTYHGQCPHSMLLQFGYTGTRITSKASTLFLYSYFFSSLKHITIVRDHQRALLLALGRRPRISGRYGAYIVVTRYSRQCPAERARSTSSEKLGRPATTTAFYAQPDGQADALCTFAPRIVALTIPSIPYHRFADLWSVCDFPVRPNACALPTFQGPEP